MARAGWLGALAVVVLTLGACGDDDDDADASAAPIDAATLEGRTFVSTEVEGEAPVDGAEVTLTFERQRLSARAGCNTLFGGFEIDAGALIADQLAQTHMGCDDALQAQDAWLSELVQDRPTIALAGDDLTLSSESVIVTLSDEASGGA
jgi:heat shock protein HslJ